MREITNLIDAFLVHVPPIYVLLLEDAALAHQMIDTGHVRGKLALKVTELYDRSPRRDVVTAIAPYACGVSLGNLFFSRFLQMRLLAELGPRPNFFI